MRTASLVHRAGPIALAAALAAAAGACSKSKGASVPSAFALHYHRAAGDYAGWTVKVAAGAEETSAAASSTDGFGAVYALTVKAGAASLDFQLENGAQVDGAGALSVDVSGTVREAWVFSGSPAVAKGKLPAVPKDATQVAVYYARPDGIYDGWGLHLWGDQVTETLWSSPLQPAGVSEDLGLGFVVDIKTGGPAKNCPPGLVCLIVHKGDQKDPGPDMAWDRSLLGDIVFVSSGSAVLTSAPVAAGAAAIVGASAHLLSRDTLAWKVGAPDAIAFELRWSPAADVKTAGTDVVGGSAIPLAPRPSGLTAAQAAADPHLVGPDWLVFDVAAADLAALESGLKGQMVAVARKADGAVAKATLVQTARALDDLYAYDGPLGVAFDAAGAPTFRLWAPTAQSVTLHLYDAAKAEVAAVSPAQVEPGVWTYAGPASWKGHYYRYELAVYHPATGKVEALVATDPYAASLSTNGAYAQVVDLSDPSLEPPGWQGLVKPPLPAPEDIVVYEGHVRDFSATDLTVPAARRGKYLAFVTEPGAAQSDGLAHLAALASAGLTHLHLLPAFDFATVDEDPANRVDLDQPFSRLCSLNAAVPAATCAQFAASTVLEAMQGYPGDSDQQQAIAGLMRGIDSFNWGYDPLHFGVPEGSYASDAEGTVRILEFRRMVQGLAGVGLRVVMDVVYNHTNAAGVGPKSVLDKVVPWYYHRLDPETGYVLSSSCCSNTASEHHMMEKLMVDLTVRWARDYKVDGFRFDLMGLHLKSNMEKVLAALQALTPAADGVDGSAIYVYGEGWDMGEMAKNARGVNATQANMAFTGIGTFNDRIRDAVRGGGPFDGGADLVKNQGFATGLYLDPNAAATALPADRDRLNQLADWIKIGMAGNQKYFRLVTATDSTTYGGAIGYGGQGVGYAEDPQEVVNYVSAHDNEVLWDIAQYKLPAGRTAAERVRAHDLALDLVLLGQGVPFVHMGDDLLRSKSMDKNSYDSGDWFNRVDWTGTANGWRSGLPGFDSVSNWTVIGPIFADAAIAPGPSDIAAASAHFQEMLRIRKSSPLFRLRSKADVLSRVDFTNYGSAQVPGVVVMTVTDGACAGADLDPGRDALVVVANADVVGHDMSVTGASGFSLHPVQAASADPVVRTASFAGGVFTVPARTTAVFEQLQAGAQGAGLPCNTR